MKKPRKLKIKYVYVNEKNLSNDINKCRLDVICVVDLGTVLSSNDIPPNYSKP